MQQARKTTTTYAHRLGMGLIWGALSFVLPMGVPGGTAPALAQERSAAEAVRSEVGKPLQAAQELIRGKRFREALVKIAEADAVPGKTAYESYLIERLRVAAAMQAGDNELAIKALGAIIASGRLSPAEHLQMIEAVVGMYYRAKDYAKAAAWAQRYFKDGGTSAPMRALLIQSYYLSNDFANAAKELQADFQADEKAGRIPAEERLQLLASCYLKQNDLRGYAAALEKMVAYHPKRDYWADLLRRIEKRPGFAERLSLDVYRLKFATGNLDAAIEYMEMAQLAIQGGYPAEAKKVVDHGFAKGVLGAGAEAERHKRLRDLAARNAAEDQKALARSDPAAEAKDATALVTTGFNYVLNGQFDRGIALMEQGLRKGGLKRPEDVQLHLGIAYFLAGHKSRAIQAFRAVKGADGTGDLSRLWVIHVNQSS